MRAMRRSVVQRLLDTDVLRKRVRRRLRLGYRWLQSTNDIFDVVVVTTMHILQFAQVVSISVC